MIGKVQSLGLKFSLVPRLLNHFRCTVLWTLIPKFGAWFWERHLKLLAFFLVKKQEA